MIYAEISKSQYKKITCGALELKFPDNVEVLRNSKGRAYYLECLTEDSQVSLEQYLEDMRICYQEC